MSSIFSAWRLYQGASRGAQKDVPEAQADREESEDVVASAVCAGQGQCEQIRYRFTQQKQLLDAGTKRCLEVASQHPNAPVPVVRGFQSEIHHEVTYNLKAVGSGMPER